MKKNEILIGRQVSKDDYVVDAAYNTVSRIHAKIKLQPDGFYIEDMDSAHGVFVNGCRVKTKKIRRSDKVFLGGPDSYYLNLAEVLGLFPISDNEFSEKIYELKKIYEEYQAQSNKLQIKGSEDMMTKRMMPTMILGSLTGILAIFVGNDTSSRVTIGIVGGLAMALVLISATKWATHSNKKMKDSLNRLNEEFELNYICPSCGGSLRGRSWEFIKRNGKCPICLRPFDLKNRD